VRCAVAPSLCEQEWRLPNYYVVARANLHSLQPYDMGHIYAFLPASLEIVRMGFNAKAFVFIDKSTRSACRALSRPPGVRLQRQRTHLLQRALLAG